MINVTNQVDPIFDYVKLQGWKELIIPSRCIPVEVVGKAAVLCATREEFKGRTLSIEDMEEIGINY